MYRTWPETKIAGFLMRSPIFFSDPTFDADAFLAYVIQKLENMDDLEDTGKFNSIVKEFPGLQ